MLVFLLILVGMVGGLIAGMVGVGGGVFYVLALPFVMDYLGLSPDNYTAFIVANSIAGISMASFVSVISQYKSMKLYWQEGVILGLSAMLSSLLLNRFFVHTPYFSPIIFRIVLIIMMFFILFKMWVLANKQTTEEKTMPLAWHKISLSGLLSGILSALTGLGGGVLVIPILQIGFKQSVQKAKLLSLCMIFVSAFAMSVQNAIAKPPTIDIHHIGYIIPQMIVPIAFGAILGAPLGVGLSKRMSNRALRFAFMAFVFMVLIDKLWRLLA